MVPLQYDGRLASSIRLHPTRLRRGPGHPRFVQLHVDVPVVAFVAVREVFIGHLADTDDSFRDLRLVRGLHAHPGWVDAVLVFETAVPAPATRRDDIVCDWKALAAAAGSESGGEGDEKSEGEDESEFIAPHRGLL